MIRRELKRKRERDEKKTKKKTKSEKKDYKREKREKWDVQRRTREKKHRFLGKTVRSMKRRGERIMVSRYDDRATESFPLSLAFPPEFLASLSRAAAAAASSSHLSLFLLFLFDVVVTSFLALAIHFFSPPPSLPSSPSSPLFHLSSVFLIHRGLAS